MLLELLKSLWFWCSFRWPKCYMKNVNIRKCTYVWNFYHYVNCTYISTKNVIFNFFRGCQIGLKNLENLDDYQLYDISWTSFWSDYKRLSLTPYMKCGHFTRWSMMLYITICEATLCLWPSQNIRILHCIWCFEFPLIYIFWYNTKYILI